MSRPIPEILASLTNADYSDLDVLLVRTLYGVAYDGKVINLRRNQINTYKYIRATFTDLAWTIILRDKLNKRFKTDRFTVVKLLPTPLKEVATSCHTCDTIAC